MKRSNFVQVTVIVLTAIAILAAISIGMSKLDEMLGTVC